MWHNNANAAGMWLHTTEKFTTRKLISTLSLVKSRS